MTSQDALNELLTQTDAKAKEESKERKIEILRRLLRREG